MNARFEIRPNVGPQEEFLATSADMAFFGGAAGGGKSYAALLDHLRWCGDPQYGGIIFRRESVDLVGPGSIWEEAQELYRKLGGSFVASPVHRCRFPSGAMVEFRHMQLESDRFSHQGKQYSVITFEELTHFTAPQFWYAVSRKRTKARVRPYVRATLNPDPDHFSRKMVDWWIGEDGYPIPERSGVIRHFVRDKKTDELVWFDTEDEALATVGGDRDEVTSFTFILSRLKDNPKIDPSYRGALLSQDRVTRERLLGDDERGGNWNIKPAPGLYFRRSMFRVLERAPHEHEVKRRVRFWDKASTPFTGSNDPDWTCGVRVAELKAGGYVVEHVEWLRAGPAEVQRTIRATAETDGLGVEVGLWQDPAQAGVVDVEHMREVLKGFRITIIRASRDKVTYAGTWQSQAESATAGAPGRIAVVRGPWLELLLTQLEAFPDPKTHDDGVDAMSGAFQMLLGNAIVEALLDAYAKA